MDYASLGASLAALNKNLPVPANVRGAVADVIDGAVVVVDKVQEVLDGIEEFAEAFNLAHIPEGWGAAVDEVKPERTRAEELTLRAKLDYIASYGDSAKQAWAQSVVSSDYDDTSLELLDFFINSWYKQTVDKNRYQG